MRQIQRTRLAFGVALFNTIVYSLISIWYLYLRIVPYRSISLSVQLCTLFLALSGIAYLISSTIGHPLMILSALTVAISAEIDGDTDAVGIFLVVAAALLWSLLRSIRLQDATDAVPSSPR
jgi:hypothetical protein